MKIAVEITIFGHHFNEVVGFPGEPSCRADVVAWLMSQTDYKWVNYDTASYGDKLMYHFDEGVTN